MNKFDELSNKNKKKKAQTIEGCFSCQTCDQLVEVAELEDELLVWRCSDGHISKIKGFQL